MRPLARQAWAALLVAGCAGAPPVHPDADPLLAEIRELHKQNEALSARVEALSNRIDLLTARATRSGDRQAPEAASDGSSSVADASVGARPPGWAGAEIPPDLAVVKVAPEPARGAGARGPGRAVRPSRAAPPVPTAVAIQDPDPASLDALARSGRRPLAAEAEQELREARALTGLLPRAHALEDFAGRYPQHPAADNALVEASAAYEAGGRDDAACSLVRRVIDEYPAGDAQSDAIERLAACESRRGAVDAEQRLLARLRADFPGTPAARRAEARSSQASGRSGETAPRDVPARSSP